MQLGINHFLWAQDRLRQRHELFTLDALTRELERHSDNLFENRTFRLARRRKMAVRVALLALEKNGLASRGSTKNGVEWRVDPRSDPVTLKHFDTILRSLTHGLSQAQQYAVYIALARKLAHLPLKRLVRYAKAVCPRSEAEMHQLGDVLGKLGASGKQDDRYLDHIKRAESPQALPGGFDPIFVAPGYSSAFILPAAQLRSSCSSADPKSVLEHFQVFHVVFPHLSQNGNGQPRAMLVYVERKGRPISNHDAVAVPLDGISLSGGDPSEQKVRLPYVLFMYQTRRKLVNISEHQLFGRQSLRAREAEHANSQAELNAAELGLAAFLSALKKCNPKTRVKMVSGWTAGQANPYIPPGQLFHCYGRAPVMAGMRLRREQTGLVWAPGTLPRSIVTELDASGLERVASEAAKKVK